MANKRKLFVNGEEIEVEIEKVDMKVKVISGLKLQKGQRCTLKCGGNSFYDSNLVVEEVLGENEYLLKYSR